MLDKKGGSSKANTNYVWLKTLSSTKRDYNISYFIYQRAPIFVESSLEARKLLSVTIL
jgi:hypothetical protein